MAVTSQSLAKSFWETIASYFYQIQKDRGDLDPAIRKRGERILLALSWVVGIRQRVTPYTLDVQKILEDAVDFISEQVILLD